MVLLLDYCIYCNGWGLAITFKDNGLPGIGIVTSCALALGVNATKPTTKNINTQNLISLYS
jgi:hypothetical protein